MLHRPLPEAAIERPPICARSGYQRAVHLNVGPPKPVAKAAPANAEGVHGANVDDRIPLGIGEVEQHRAGRPVHAAQAAKRPHPFIVIGVGA